MAVTANPIAGGALGNAALGQNRHNGTAVANHRNFGLAFFHGFFQRHGIRLGLSFPDTADGFPEFIFVATDLIGNLMAFQKFIFLKNIFIPVLI